MTIPQTATRLAILASLPAAAALGAGEVITVTTLDDVSDFAGAQLVGDLPGADGRVSFREACIAANNTPGPQTIAFAIPSTEWWLFDDRAMLRQEDGVFVLSDDETTVDFTTQTDFTGDTNPDGWEVGIYGLEPSSLGVTAIAVFGDRCVVKGLDRVMQRGSGVRLIGHDNRVISCTISGPIHTAVEVHGDPGFPAMGNIVGGTAPGEGNVLRSGGSGIRIDGPVDGTVVVGNTLVGSSAVGVEVRGAYCCPEYTPYNTRIGGPTPEERNWIADNGRYGEEGFPTGTQVQVEWAVNTIVEGNFIGTTQDGSGRYPGAHGSTGIGVRESETTVLRGNLVSGIRKEGINHYSGQVFGVGITVYGPNTAVQVAGNQVGTDATGTGPVPNLNGIAFARFQGAPSGGMVGGPDAGDANLVAFNERTGLVVADGIGGVSILGNRFHDNGLLGIDLLSATGAAGPSFNDVGDADAGGNGLQNFPELATATSGGGTTTVTGTLDSTPATDFTLQFFASETCHDSGFGEGDQLVGAVLVTTDAFGQAPFSTTLDLVPAGRVVTATATRSDTGDTSEFSTCVIVEGDDTVPGDVNGDGVVDVIDLLAVIAAWGPCADPCDTCAEDIDGSCDVGVGDLLILLGNWG